MSVPSITELIERGYGRSLTVGAFSDGVVGGGAVTTTGVCGQITLDAGIGANATSTFTLTNSHINATGCVIVCPAIELNGETMAFICSAYGYGVSTCSISIMEEPLFDFTLKVNFQPINN